jgi:hypothetical protein
MGRGMNVNFLNVGLKNIGEDISWEAQGDMIILLNF